MRPEALDLLTIDDVVRAGACRGGVVAFRDRVAPLATALTVVAALASASPEESGYVERAAGLAGYGNGDGNGDGYGGSF